MCVALWGRYGLHSSSAETTASVNCAAVVMCLISCPFYGRAMAQVVSRRPLTAEARVRARVNPCGIRGGQSGTGTGFSPSSSAFPCQYIIPPSLANSYHLGVEQYVR
jgi:hypothetical protein